MWLQSRLSENYIRALITLTNPSEIWALTASATILLIETYHLWPTLGHSLHGSPRVAPRRFHSSQSELPWAPVSSLPMLLTLQPLPFTTRLKSNVVPWVNVHKLVYPHSPSHSLALGSSGLPVSRIYQTDSGSGVAGHFNFSQWHGCDSLVRF